MSEDFHHENSSKLSKCAKPFEYYSQVNNAETDSSEEEINVVDYIYPTNVVNGSLINVPAKSPPFNCQIPAESEVTFIKEWLILHTDLIQQQNDDIIDKDREIYILRKENEMLKERISCIEKGISHQFEEPDSQNIQEEVIVEDMTHGSIKEEVNDDQLVEGQYSPNNDCSLDLISYKNENCVNLSDSESQINIEPVSVTNYEENIVNTVIKLDSEDILLDDIDHSWKSKSDYYNSTIPEEVSNYSFTINNIGEFDPMKNLRMSIRRKRVTSNSSGLSHNESFNLEEKEAYRKRFKKKKRRPSKDTNNVLMSTEAYVTQSHDVSLGIISPSELEIGECPAASSLEVPRWRHKIYASCYTMEGTENLDDEVFNKRHMKLENDERRRKRWDVQRIREQRVIEKLKQRQERIALGSKGEGSEPIMSLWPTVEDIKYLEVVEELPVAAFGHPITKFIPSEFQVPWMNNPSMLTKRPHTRKSKMRRRVSKR